MYELLANPDDLNQMLCKRVLEDGNELFLTLSARKFTFNLEECMMLTIRDITFQQKLQEQRQLNEINKMLTATVSHELMTPLNCIDTFGTAIEKKLDPQRTRHYVSLIKKTAKLMKLSVRDLLDKSLIECGRFEAWLEWRNLQDVVKEAC